VPLSKDEEEVRDESAHKPGRDDGDAPRAA
jgi:hypothetical protein